MEVLLNHPSERQVIELSEREDFSFDVVPVLENRKSLLSVLVENNHLQTIEYCLRYGANVNYKGNDESPLQDACFYLNLPIARLLLRNGANVNDIDSHNVSCLARCFVPLNNDISNIDTAIEIASLLLEYGADINLRNDVGDNVLQMILADDDNELGDFRATGMRFLISRGADPHNMNNRGHTLMTGEFLNSSYADFEKMLSVAGKPKDNIMARLFIETFIHRRDFIQRLVAIYFPGITIDAEIENFIFNTVRNNGFNKFYESRNDETKREERQKLLIFCLAIFMRIIEANYINFIPRIQLYPPSKRKIIQTLMLIRPSPNELIFEILRFV